MRGKLHVRAPLSAEGQQDLTRWLERAGLNLGPTTAPCELHIVIFDESMLDLPGLIRELSQDGLRRLVAIGKGVAAPADTSPWQLLAAGACDVLVWDGSDRLAAEIVARIARWAKVDSLINSRLVQENLIGNSPVWLRTLRRMVEIAHFSDASMLIMGESGTGKELLARLVHGLDSRQDKRDLVVLDCTTIVPELAGSEFFGHERGAFTGAVAGRDGAFALAHNGTLLLDEVGELPRGLQGQLLRVIQEGTYKRVGGNTWHRSAFRLVCATNRDLSEDVRNGRFRSDLYYRIATWTFRLPALRDRPEDILPLARHFAAEQRPEWKSLDFEAAVRDFLMGRDYPGNVRDLRHLISRVVNRHVGDGIVTVGDIPEEDRPSAYERADSWSDGVFQMAINRAITMGVRLKEIGRIAEDTAVRVALQAENGNLPRAAHRLGVSDRALQLRRAAGRFQEPSPEPSTDHIRTG